LQHPDGPVGFDNRQGADIIKALARDVIVIERANSPEWLQLKMDALPNRPLDTLFMRVISCSIPAPNITKELEVVSSNKKQISLNKIRARHGKPDSPISKTIFDDWITPSGLLREGTVRWMIDVCQTFIIWSFSERGLYASILGHSAEAVLEPVLRAAKELNIPMRQVQSKSKLPVW